MLKTVDSVKALEHRAAKALRELLEQVPTITLQDVETTPLSNDQGVDFVFHIDVDGRQHTLACQIKTNSEPRQVPLALLRLKQTIAHLGANATSILIAPYLSPKARELCRTFDSGFLDLEGNARIVFDGVFIERLVESRPPAERRELRSIFKPKAAQVLRTMLRDPRRVWRVAELAEAADVSLGHVSNVRTALVDREWAKVDRDGMFLTDPDALLDAWRDAYDPPPGDRMDFYTTLHGKAFDEAARGALGIAETGGSAVLASFSAAQWLAPYARTGSHFFYADESGAEALKQALKLSPAGKGGNVVITVLKDRGLFRDSVEPAPGVFCTSPVQTYLDLSRAGERGAEAAEHLRLQRLTWLQ